MSIGRSASFWRLTPPPPSTNSRTQLEVFPGRVQHGLLSALLDVGEPKATRMYFEARRAQAQPVSPETPDYYRAMLEGRCRQARCGPRLGAMVEECCRQSRCSPRLAESLR